MLRENEDPVRQEQTWLSLGFHQASFMIFLFWVIRDRETSNLLWYLLPLFLVVVSSLVLLCRTVLRALTAVKGNKARSLSSGLSHRSSRRALIAHYRYLLCVMVIILGLLSLYGYTVTLDKPAMILMSLPWHRCWGLAWEPSARHSIRYCRPPSASCQWSCGFCSSPPGCSFRSVRCRSISRKFLLQPRLHTIEMLRTGLSASYPEYFISLPYVMASRWWPCCLVAAGALFTELHRPGNMIELRNLCKNYRTQGCQGGARPVNAVFSPGRNIGILAGTAPASRLCCA